MRAPKRNGARRELGGPGGAGRKRGALAEKAPLSCLVNLFGVSLQAGSGVPGGLVITSAGCTWAGRSSTVPCSIRTASAIALVSLIFVWSLGGSWYDCELFAFD